MKHTFIALLALSTTLASANDNKLKENRLGSIVINKETSEEIYFSCVDQNADNQCVAYRFVSQMGPEMRILGNYNLEVHESAENKVARYELYNGGSLTPALKKLETYDDLGFPFALVPAAFYLVHDAVRLTVSLPYQVVKKTIRNSHNRKVNDAFKSLFMSNERDLKNKLSEKNFIQLHELVLKIAVQDEVTVETQPTQ